MGKLTLSKKFAASAFLVALIGSQAVYMVFTPSVNNAEAATVHATSFSGRTAPVYQLGGGAPLDTARQIHWTGVNGGPDQGAVLLLSGLQAGQIITGSVSGEIDWGSGDDAPCATGNPGDNIIPKLVAVGQFTNDAGTVMNYSGGESNTSAFQLGRVSAGVTVPAGATRLVGSFPDSDYTDNHGTCHVNLSVNGGGSNPVNPPAGGATPIGNVNGANNIGVDGWACDADNFNTAIDVHIYVDGPYGQGGRLVVAGPANGFFGDNNVASVCGGNANHAFRLNWPASANICDGQVHSVYAYGINTPNGPNVLLSGVPKTVQCTGGGNPGGGNGNPIGSLDAVSQHDISGWACDLDNVNTPITVHLYRDGKYGQGGVIFDSVTAGNLRDNGVRDACGGNPNHGFYIPPPASLCDGQPHDIYAYGININGTNGQNTLLSNTPQTITCFPQTSSSGNGTVDTVVNFLTVPFNIQKGQNLTYTGRVGNNGPQTATNVVFRMPVPAGTSFIPSLSYSGCSQQGNQVVCNNSNISSGQFGNFTVVFNTSNAQCNGTVMTNLSVTQAEADRNPENNSTASVNTNILCGTASSSTPSNNSPFGSLDGAAASGIGGWACDGDNFASPIRVDLYADGPWTPGRVPFASPTANIPAEIEVQSNCGNFANHRFLAPVPAYLCDGQPHQIYAYGINIGASGENRLLFYSPRTLLCGPGSSSSSSTNNNADLSINKTGSAVTTRGNLMNYTITVSNAGPAAATNVVVSDPLQSGMTFNSSTGASCYVDSGTVYCPLNTINAGTSKTVTITVRTPALGACSTSTVQNVATVSSNQNDPNSGNNQSQVVSTTVNCPVSSSSSSTHIPECRDGIDNDNDGATDFPNDFSCSSDNDDDETFPKAQCQDGFDNDGDGLIDFPLDPGCYSYQDNDETNASSSSSSTPNSSDLNIFKFGSAVTTRGTDMSYSITVGNAGPAAATNVVVTDVLQSGMTLVTSTGANCTVAGATVSCPLGTITSGSSKTVTIVVRTPAIANCTTATVQNVATVTSSQNDPNSGNNQSQVVSTTVHCPTSSSSSSTPNTSDLSITKSGPANTTRGDTFTYSIVVYNAGPAQATGVMVQDPLQNGMTFISAAGANCSVNGSTVNCPLDTINAGTSKTITLTVRMPVIANCTASVVQNIAYVTGNQNDNNTSNNTSGAVTTAVNCSSSSSSSSSSSTSGGISIDVTDSVDPVDACQYFSYTTRVTNTSNVNRTLNVTQVLSNRVEFQSATSGGVNSNGVVTWNNVFVGANSVITLTTNVRASCSVSDNETLTTTTYVENLTDTETTRVDLDNDDDDDDNDIRLSIVDDRDPVAPGALVRYTITVENRGNTRRTVDVTAYLDSDTTFDSASDDYDRNGSNRVTWENVRIDDDDEETFEVTVRVRTGVSNGKRLELRAKAGSEDETEETRVSGTTIIDNGNNTGTVSVSKTSDRYEANPGDTVTYTVTVRNYSSNTISGFQVYDSFNPAMLTIFDPAGGSLNGGTISWSNITLAPNQVRTIVYSGRLANNLKHGDVVRNNVTVQGGNISQPAASSNEIRIVTRLPQTGISDYLNPLSDKSMFLSPIRSAGAGSVAGLIVTTLTVLALGIGGTVGKRYFL